MSQRGTAVDVDYTEEAEVRVKPRPKKDTVQVTIRRSLYESLKMIAGFNGRTVPEVVDAILTSKAVEVEEALKSIDLSRLIEF